MIIHRNDLKIAVIVPCYKVKQKILAVISAIGPEVQGIYVVDDACPEGSGSYAVKHSDDIRIKVLFHKKNQGVGSAVLTGYREAISDGYDILVKVDGDGQMDPRLISRFIAPIINGEADYTKGNRFFNIEDVQGMPFIRILGNAVLSFFTKLSCGYWKIFDPNNGYTAIHARVAEELPVDKISKRYFFESDILFRLNCIRGKVIDVPMIAHYDDEQSNLKILHIIPEFMLAHFSNTVKRIFYNYFLRDFHVASLELILGLIFIFFGISFGIYEWVQSIITGVSATAGTVMLAALPIIIGLQFVLAFVNYDIANSPDRALHKSLNKGN